MKIEPQRHKGRCMDSKKIAIVSLLFILFSWSTNMLEAAQDYAGLLELAKEYYDWQAETSPTVATDSGLHTYDDRLADFSPAALAKFETGLKTFRDKFSHFNPQSWTIEQK